MDNRRISERDRRACLLAGIADVTTATAARFLNNEPMQRKQRQALERAVGVALDRLPEIASELQLGSGAAHSEAASR